MIIVVAALIRKDNKVLLAKRATGDENVFGKWEFPGGKLEKGETEKEALKREIREEFELDIEVNDFVINNVCEYPTRKIDLRLYECKYLDGEFKLHDHSEYNWVDVDKLLEYDLAKADVPFAKYLMEK